MGDDTQRQFEVALAEAERKLARKLIDKLEKDRARIDRQIAEQHAEVARCTGIINAPVSVPEQQP